MKSDFYLPGLNNRTSSSRKQIEVDAEKCPKLALLLSDAEGFYKMYCDNLDNVIIREKRFLDFETPNRAVITHEYDIEITDTDKKPFDYKKAYYLFNPMERLGWLKILQDSERGVVVGEAEIKKNVVTILKEELSESGLNFDTIWSAKEGLPCFIRLKDIDKTSFILSASYYDSMYEENMTNTMKQILYPIMERRVRYDYIPLKGRSSWLYIHAPANFEVCYNKTEPCGSDLYTIEGPAVSGQQKDPDIVSLTIRHNDRNSVQRVVVPITFEIVLPWTVKFWDYSIYYSSVVVSIILLCNICNKLYLKFYPPIFQLHSVDELCSDEQFPAFVLALIAAIIATRGWMIKEETILKKYSKYLTILMIALTLLFFINALL